MKFFFLFFLFFPKRIIFYTDFMIYNIGFGHGSNVEKSHELKTPVKFQAGINNISLLAMTVGFPVISETKLILLLIIGL